ncbi:MAG TPA: hypothetical protein VG820_09250 [Fimbriimonadaceae bacterium]|nr:hypothetical protein [Fimbriimonadaceae bacterium]
MRLKYLLALLAVLLTLSGCGGSGIFSPFTGTWDGTWAQTSPADTGTAGFIVLPSGSLSGSMHDNNANVDYTISGTINDAGLVTATITPSGGSGQSMSGTLAFNGSNQLLGTLTVTGGTLNTLSFLMNPQ